MLMIVKESIPIRNNFTHVSLLGVADLLKLITVTMLSEETPKWQYHCSESIPRLNTASQTPFYAIHFAKTEIQSVHRSPSVHHRHTSNQINHALAKRDVGTSQGRLADSKAHLQTATMDAGSGNDVNNADRANHFVDSGMLAH